MKLIAIALACIALSLMIISCTETAPTTNNTAPTTAASPAKPVDEFAAAHVVRGHRAVLPEASPGAAP